MKFIKTERHWKFAAIFAFVTLFMAAATPASAEGLLKKIKDRGKIVVGTEAAFPPFEFVKDGKIVGYHKDILDFIVAELKVELDQLDLPFQGIIPGLIANKFDMVATAVAINPERAKKVAYTLPTSSINNEIIVKTTNKDIKGPNDLNGKIVATQLASSIQPIAEKHNEELKAAGGPGYKQLKLYQAFPETILALSSGQVDAILIATTVLIDLNKKRPGAFKSVGTLGGKEWLCWITRPSDLDVRDFVNSNIRKLRDSGKLAELQKKWFGQTFEIPDSGYLPAGAF